MTEQRRHLRYAVEIAAEVGVGGEVLVASTQNMSEGGVGLVLDRPLEEGTTIKLNLFLTEDGIEDPDEEPLVVKATVAWGAEQDSGVHAAGVRFAKLTPEQSKQVARFLAALES